MRGLALKIATGPLKKVDRRKGRDADSDGKFNEAEGGGGDRRAQEAERAVGVQKRFFAEVNGAAPSERRYLSKSTGIIPEGMDRAVDFRWGYPGDSSRDYKGGFGLSHIIAKRIHVDKIPKADAFKLVYAIPHIIATGKWDTGWYQEGDHPTKLRNIRSGNRIVVIADRYYDSRSNKGGPPFVKTAFYDVNHPTTKSRYPEFVRTFHKSHGKTDEQIDRILGVNKSFDNDGLQKGIGSQAARKTIDLAGKLPKKFRVIRNVSRSSTSIGDVLVGSGNEGKLFNTGMILDFVSRLPRTVGKRVGESIARNVADRTGLTEKLSRRILKENYSELLRQSIRRGRNGPISEFPGEKDIKKIPHVIGGFVGGALGGIAGGMTSLATANRVARKILKENYSEALRASIRDGRKKALEEMGSAPGVFSSKSKKKAYEAALRAKRIEYGAKETKDFKRLKLASLKLQHIKEASILGGKIGGNAGGALASAYAVSRVKNAFWREEDHPRDTDGKFRNK